MSYTYKELENYTVVQLKTLLDYEGIEYSYKDRKPNLIDKLLQLPLPGMSVQSEQELPPASVRIQRIRDSK